MKDYQTIQVLRLHFQDTKYNVTAKVILGHLLHPGLFIPDAIVCYTPPSSVNCGGGGGCMAADKQTKQPIVHLLCSICYKLLTSSSNCHYLFCSHSSRSVCCCLPPTLIHDLPFINWSRVICHHISSPICQDHISFHLQSHWVSYPYLEECTSTLPGCCCHFLLRCLFLQLFRIPPQPLQQKPGNNPGRFPVADFQAEHRLAWKLLPPLGLNEESELIGKSVG